MRNPLLKVTVFLFCLGIGWAQQPPPTAQASTEGKNAQASKPVLCGAKIYIASMPDDLDGYIRAQFLKQHVPLAIVMEKGAHRTRDDGREQGASESLGQFRDCRRQHRRCDDHRHTRKFWMGGNGW